MVQLEILSESGDCWEKIVFPALFLSKSFFGDLKFASAQRAKTGYP